MDENDLDLLNQLMDAKDPRAQEIFKKMTPDEASSFMVWKQKNPSGSSKHLIDLVDTSNADEEMHGMINGMPITGLQAVGGLPKTLGNLSNLIRGGPDTMNRAPKKPGMIGNIEGGPINWHSESTAPRSRPNNLIQGGMDEGDKRSIMFGGAGDRSRPRLRTPIDKASLDKRPYSTIIQEAARPRKPSK